MSRQKSLKLLHLELNTLSTFDRLHDLAPAHNEIETRCYEARQIRRTAITVEIERLNASGGKSLMNGVRGVVLLCAVGFAALDYLLSRMQLK